MYMKLAPLRVIRLMTMSTGPRAQQGSSPSVAYTAETYERRDEHTANTGKGNEESYILALHTDQQHYQTMTDLRQKHFPPKINKLAAHITLFHALPGSELPRIVNDISDVASSSEHFSVSATKPFRMRRGVGIRVSNASAAKTIFDRLKEKWEPFLSQQDGSFKAHYTIQNKVEDDSVVEQTIKDVEDNFHGSTGRVDGLSLYRYDRGYWRKERDFPFGLS